MDRKLKGCDPRGSAAARRSRREWLLSERSGWGGNGVTAPCALRTETNCERFVDFGTLEVDRIVPGAEGGSYRRDNIRPTCRKCNQAAGFETLRAVLASRVN